VGLFGDTKTPKPPVSTQPPATSSQQLGLQPSQLRSPCTIIGQSLSVTGEMTSEEDVIIEGRFSGRLISSARITIGRTGQVDAELTGTIIQISGRVKGNLTARQKIEIIASGFLEGNIRTPKVIVAEGAVFKGNVEMPTDEAAPSKVNAEPVAAAAGGARPRK